MHSMHGLSVNSLPAWGLPRALRCRSTPSSSNILSEKLLRNMGYIVSIDIFCAWPCIPTKLQLIKRICCPAHNGRRWVATKQQCRYPAWKRFSRLSQTPLPVLVASLGQRCSKVQTWSNMCTSIRRERWQNQNAKHGQFCQPVPSNVYS